jgi:SIT4-associating protein SAP185/190
MVTDNTHSPPPLNLFQWLSSHDLIPKMVELLSPKYSIDLHNTVSELLKAIIALSAPSPAGMTSGQDAFGYGNSASFGGQEQALGVQNKLVRELASEPMVRKMVSFMLDSAHGSELTEKLSTAADERTATDQQSEDADEEDDVLTFGTRTAKPAPSSFSALDESSAIDDADDTDPQPLNPSLTPAFDPHGAAHRDSTATVRPTNFFPPVSAPQNPITRETSSSSLITGIGIFIELIRKNNSDYFEQHLFHALRSHLLQRQQEIAAKKAQARSEAGATSSCAASEGGAPASSEEGEKDEEEEEMEGMEEAMLEMTDKLGIVHLGPMLTALCERLSEFQALIERPSSAQNQILTTLGKVNALSFERYRIAELYAELLHCSNMALLNRPAGDGPHYSSSGVLQGGIQGLQVLARTLQGVDADDTSDTPGAVAASAEEPASPSSGANGESSMPSSDGKPPSATPQGRHARQASTAGASEDDAGGVNASGEAESDPFADEASAPESTPESDHPQAGEAAVLAEDAKSIRSALSSMSLANLTTPQHSEPPSPMSDSAEQVVGDLLKKKFLDCDVIPTILSLFFEYPWNNFFHNVVYDILQQCFNGRMDAGLNRKLTVAVFEKGRLPEKILEGQQRNNESTKGPRRIRLGYMGHLNLIAEETVKLLERYPQEIGDAVSSSVPQPAWDEFVNESLKENREKESAPLAGGKPMTGGFGFGGASANQGSGSDDDGGRNGAGVGQSGDNETFANYLSAQMGGTSSDDDDSDEEASWLTQDPRSSGFADAFQPGSASSASVTATTKLHEDQDDDDDEWGPFSASEGGGISSTSKFDFQSSASQPLTSADWAASAFDRSDSPGDGSALDDSATGGEDEDGEATSPSDEHYPFVDLSDATSYRIAQASAASLQRRRSSGAGSSSSAGFPAIGRRRASSSAGSGSTDPSAAQAVDEGEPMGPGVSSKDTEVKDGMLIRKLSDGSTVSVPLDDVALAQLAEDQKEGSGESALVDD